MKKNILICLFIVLLLIDIAFTVFDVTNPILIFIKSYTFQGIIIAIVLWKIFGHTEKIHIMSYVLAIILILFFLLELYIDLVQHDVLSLFH
jgi:hypothetical protein